MSFDPKFELYEVAQSDTSSGAKIGDLTGWNFPLTFDISIDRWGIARATATFVQTRFNQFREFTRGREIRAFYDDTHCWGKYWIQSRSSNLKDNTFTLELVGASAFYESATPDASSEVLTPTYAEVAAAMAVACDLPLPYGTWTSTQFDDAPYVITPKMRMLDVLRTLTTMDTGGFDSSHGGFMSTWDVYYNDTSKHDLLQASVSDAIWATYTIGTNIDDIQLRESDDQSYTDLEVVGRTQADGNSKATWAFPNADYPYPTGITPIVIPTGVKRIYTHDANGLTSIAAAGLFWEKWAKVFVPLRPQLTIAVRGVGSTMPLPARGRIKVVDEYGVTVDTYYPEKVSIRFIQQNEDDPIATFQVGVSQVDWDVAMQQLESRILNVTTPGTLAQVYRQPHTITARTYLGPPTTTTWDWLNSPDYGMTVAAYSYALTIKDPVGSEPTGGIMKPSKTGILVKGLSIYDVGDTVDVVTVFDSDGATVEQYIQPAASIDLNRNVTDGSVADSLEAALGFTAGGTLAPRSV